MNSSPDLLLNFPLRCRPLYKAKIWGGRGLERVLGKVLPPGELIGESWEVADVPAGCSSIADGPLAGLTLREVTQQFGEQLLPGSESAEFPLLVKFLDVQQMSSVQVHPTADVCSRLYPLERGKTETWIILDAAPDAAVLHGVQEGVTLEEIRGRITDGSIMQIMRRIGVAHGDVVHLPAGTLHALLPGVVLLEVQEPSDSTFRVHDHDRIDADGLPRELHVDQALESIHVRQTDAAIMAPVVESREWGTREVLVNINAYRVERLKLTGMTEWRYGDAPAVVVVTAGDALAVRWGGEEAVYHLGETFIMPPAVENAAIRSEGSSVEIIVAFPSE